MGVNFDRKEHSGSGLNSERKEIIKRRISEKYYDREEVLLEVAKRILESHDLEDFPNKKNLLLN